MAITSSSDLELRGPATGFTAALQNGRVVLIGELDIASVESLRIVLDQALLESENRFASTPLNFLSSTRSPSPSYCDIRWPPPPNTVGSELRPPRGPLLKY